MRAWVGLVFVAALALSLAVPSSASAWIDTYRVQAGPTGGRFGEPSYALINPLDPKTAPLVVFLPGSGGRPQHAVDFLRIVVAQGYRAIALEYDDLPAVAGLCPQDPDPDCASAFRRMRVDGDGPSNVVSNPPDEAIIPRLRAALRELNRAHPNDGWGEYLVGDEINWERIVVSGLSQGAGMAAYIAKHHLVKRVVLFSGPWDVTSPNKHPAPWLTESGLTPPDRWFVEYHRRENTAALLQNAYIAMSVPPDHIFIFDQDLPADFQRDRSPNPYHVNTILDHRYEPKWREMFGQAGG